MNEVDIQFTLIAKNEKLEEGVVTHALTFLPNDGEIFTGNIAISTTDGTTADFFNVGTVYNIAITEAA